MHIARIMEPLFWMSLVENSQVGSTYWGEEPEQEPEPERGLRFEQGGRISGVVRAY